VAIKALIVMFGCLLHIQCVAKITSGGFQGAEPAPVRHPLRCCAALIKRPHKALHSVSPSLCPSDPCFQFTEIGES